MPPKTSARTEALRTRKSRRVATAKKTVDCPIVGIGGSAGGFEATMDLLRHLPAKNGMTFVAVRERRVTDKRGRQYSLRIRPYRTGDNKIDGVVITPVDFDTKE